MTQNSNLQIKKVPLLQYHVTKDINDMIVIRLIHILTFFTYFFIINPVDRITPKRHNACIKLHKDES